MRTHGRTSLAGRLLCTILAAVPLAGCRDGGSSLRSPTALPPIPAEGSGNFVGDATVVSASGGAGCGWGTHTGETRSGVSWFVEVAGTTIALNEDMSNWPTDHIPFTGTLDGRHFTARYWQGDDYLRWVCQFREATITGTFSEDFSAFEAHEVLYWGAPSDETRVERVWSVRRL